MIDQTEAFVLAASDFGESATFSKSDASASASISGLFEHGALAETQNGVEVIDTRPHFTTAASGASSYAEGDTVQVRGLIRTILDVHQDESIFIFVLDKIGVDPTVGGAAVSVPGGGNILLPGGGQILTPTPS